MDQWFFLYLKISSLLLVQVSKERINLQTENSSSEKFRIIFKAETLSNQ